MTTALPRTDRRVSPVFLALTAVLAVSGWAVWSGALAARAGIAVFLFVTSGWVVSLCLHEYAHARTALHAGDHTVGAKGYLSLNPFVYSHALLSVVLPVLFLLMGGIGLPGGAVFIERDRIPGRVRHSLVSAAGPLTNVLFAVVVSAPFWLHATDGVPLAFRSALAFLALLQVTAALLNFLPVPGLDGYGVLAPWLPEGVRRQVAPLAPFGLLAVFVLLWTPEVGDAFFSLVRSVLAGLGVPALDTSLGRELFRFWEGGPQL
ncbi:site-2 protease family protein [Streptomyces sp. RS10V-4]|uniref:site-2 protease family protein n=1 Tax=Streptomyces rhizoryzae TaxID=2932493 RepID=UPI00200482E2|nr:site-2 protease family protein [Streptomyces rhizoryzae]MCK7623496.1 site-2 protease family protein [Streptomyces rhizoryzae]